MNSEKRSLLAVYGILKRAGSLPLTYMRGSKFVAEGTIKGSALFSIGYGVGLRLEPKYITIERKPTYVELWDILSENWPHLDALEQNGRNYERKIVPVMLHDGTTRDAWVYEHIHCDPEWYNDERLILSGNYGGSRYAQLRED